MVALLVKGRERKDSKVSLAVFGGGGGGTETGKGMVSVSLQTSL